MPEGETPYTLMLYAYQGLCDSVLPGDRVTVRSGVAWWRRRTGQEVALAAARAAHCLSAHASLPLSRSLPFPALRCCSQITGILKAQPVRPNPRQRTSKAVYRTWLDVQHFASQESGRLSQQVSVRGGALRAGSGDVARSPPDRLTFTPTP